MTMPPLLPEPGVGAGAGGAGAEFRLFDMDPDAAALRAEVVGWHILQPLIDKFLSSACHVGTVHGSRAQLREATKCASEWW